MAKRKRKKKASADTATAVLEPPTPEETAAKFASRNKLIANRQQAQRDADAEAALKKAGKPSYKALEKKNTELESRLDRLEAKFED